MPNDGFPETKHDPTEWMRDLGKRVRRMVKNAACLEHWREMVRAWAEQFCQLQAERKGVQEQIRRKLLAEYDEEHDEWDRQCTEFVEGIQTDARLRDKDAGPPKPGWAFVRHLTRHSKSGCDEVQGWTPGGSWQEPENPCSIHSVGFYSAIESVPRPIGPLPLPDRELSLEEQHAVLAGIHDCVYMNKGVAKIDPSAAPRKREDGEDFVRGEEVSAAYRCQVLRRVPELRERDREVLEDFLDAIEKEWQAKLRIESCGAATAAKLPKPANRPETPQQERPKPGPLGRAIFRLEFAVGLYEDPNGVQRDYQKLELDFPSEHETPEGRFAWVQESRKAFEQLWATLKQKADRHPAHFSAEFMGNLDKRIQEFLADQTHRMTVAGYAGETAPFKPSDDPDLIADCNRFEERLLAASGPNDDALEAQQKPATEAAEALNTEDGSGAGKPETHGDAEAPAIDDDSHLSPAKLAKVFDVSAEPLRTRLNRWRMTNHNGWIENPNRKPREAKYLYRVGAVRCIIDELIATTQATSERPAKKN